MVFVSDYVYVVNYVYRLAYVEPGLHPRDEACLIMMDKLFDVLLQFIYQYFIEDFTLMFIRDVGLKFYLLVVSARFWCQDDAGLIK